MPDSEWESETSGYSLSKFYTASREKKGFSTTVRVAIPPYVLGGIQQLVASGKIPEYQTSADFVRDAIAHRLKWLEDNPVPEVSEYGKNLRMVSEAEKFSEQLKARNNLIRLRKEQAGMVRSTADRQQLQNLIMQDQRLTDDEWLRSELQSILLSL